MASRIEIKLTKKLDSSTWRWQATKLARRGIISTAQVPHGARVDDVLTIEVSSALEGSVIRRVIPPEQASAAKSETMTERPESPKEKRQRKPQSSKKARSAENRRVASLVRELTTLGGHEKAIRLCEEHGWEPSQVDPRLWQPQLGRALGDIYPWLWEAADEPLDFEERLLSLRVLWRYGIYTHGLLAEKSFDELQALRGLGNAKLALLDRYFKERAETSPVPKTASRQKRRTKESGLGVVDSGPWQPQLGRALGDIYSWLWEAADEPLDFEERLLSLRILWRHGIYTHGLLAEKSFDELQALRGLGKTKLSFLDSYLRERAETSPVPKAASRQKHRTEVGRETASSSSATARPGVATTRTVQAESEAEPTFEFRRQESGIAVSQGSVSGPAFFDVKNQKGDLEIRISDSHPSFPLLLSELDPSTQSVLLMVLQSWAEMESDAVGTARQVEIEDARLEWGRYLRHLLLRLQDQA